MERKAPWWDFSMRSSGKRMGSVSHWNIVFHFLVLFITSFPFETNLRLNSKVNWQWKGTFFWDMKWIRLNVIFTATHLHQVRTHTARVTLYNWQFRELLHNYIIVYLSDGVFRFFPVFLFLLYLSSLYFFLSNISRNTVDTTFDWSFQHRGKK